MPKSIKGRGASYNPPNRFQELRLEPITIEWEEPDEGRPVQTSFFKDTTKAILAKNDSPDIGFTYSINPYRGCEHGCIYCYARPSHEYLGFSAGLDFESRIMVKLNAPQLLERTFLRKSWKPQMVCFSGNTDCYQPVEQKLQLTRQCLTVFLAFRNPVGIITKNALISRDIDILKDLASFGIVRVMISMTSLNEDLIRKMEPRTAMPEKRLETIALLASHGIPVGVNLAPIIPGLNDEEIPSLLREASLRGAQFAGMAMIRLPGIVSELFCDWLKREFPLRYSKIISRIRDIRGGKLDEAQWNVRLTGIGETTAAIRKLFDTARAKYGLNTEEIESPTKHFKREPKEQLNLFV